MDSLAKVYCLCLLLHLILSYAHFVRQFDSDCEVFHYRGFLKSVDVFGQRGPCEAFEPTILCSKNVRTTMS